MRLLKISLSPLKTVILVVITAVLIGIGYALATRTGTNPFIDSQAPLTNDTSGTSLETKTSARAMPVHQNIIATVFWVGEGADSDNDFIHNRSSAWMEDWQGAYGGVDSNEERCGYNPCDFTPKENPFYFALPFNDYGENGEAKSVSVLQNISWYNGQPKQGTSLLKNRWVKITSSGKTVYAQWEDVGPFNEDDLDYVFGNERPKEARAGIDLSPATATYLAIDGRAVVSWQFVDQAQVPDGPWKSVITTSGLRY